MPDNRLQFLTNHLKRQISLYRKFLINTLQNFFVYNEVDFHSKTNEELSIMLREFRNPEIFQQESLLIKRINDAINKILIYYN